MRRRVAEHGNTPLEILRQLAHDSSWWVRRNVARNSNTPVEVLQQLADDFDDSVKKAGQLSLKKYY